MWENKQHSPCGPRGVFFKTPPESVNGVSTPLFSPRKIPVWPETNPHFLQGRVGPTKLPKGFKLSPSKSFAPKILSPLEKIWPQLRVNFQTNVCETPPHFKRAKQRWKTPLAWVNPIKEIPTVFRPNWFENTQRK